MRRSHSRLTAVSLFVLFVPLVLSAASYIVPSDAEMIQRSDDIVVANAMSVTVERTPNGGIVTRYLFVIDEVLKGDRTLGSTLRLTEIGGRLNGLGLVVPGSPIYEAGVKYLIFTEMNVEGEARTFGMELGQFRFERDGSGHLLALRAPLHGWDANLQPFSERPRDAAGFAEYIRGIVAQRVDPYPTYFVDPKAAAVNIQPQSFTRGSYLVAGEPRWQGPSTSLVTSGTQGSLDGVGSVTNAIAAWNGTTSDIAYSYGGQDNTAVAGFTAHDGKDAVLFNDPNNEVNPPVLGLGGYWITGATHLLDGETFTTIDGGVDVVIDQAVTTTGCLLDVMTHEVGHTFGFRHANQSKSGGACAPPLDCSSGIMNSSVSCSTGGALQGWDNAAAETVYGAGPVCTPPSINTHPASTTITQGNNTTLTVAAVGTALTYQWYIGANPDASQPTGTNSASLQVSPSSTTSYWVRVTGQCGTADSNTATVTVNPPSCTPPSINSHPSSITINEGTGTTLGVSAGGTSPLSYQWYIGTTGNTSTPTGTNSFSLFVNPSSTTSFWVRVTGQCAPPADSNTATVTVNPAPCVPPAINGHPQSVSIAEGQSTVLFVSASGSGLTYQWYIGNSGNTSQPTATNSNTISVSPSVTTSYWVRVSGACGSPVDSLTATVTVTVCPDVLVGTPLATKQPNGSYVLTVAADSDGLPLTFQWFRGTTPGVGGTFLGAGSSIAVPAPTGPTSYWVRVSNNCNKSAVSPLVTISTCELPVISTQPADQSIASGGSATLSVAFTPAAGATVQWYRGTAPDKSNQVGTGTTFNTGALTTTTSFFASITNSCGEVLTRTAIVSISCIAPSLTQPPNQTVTKGKPATITVVATGSAPLTYQWYQGALGVVLFPVGTSSATLVTAPLTSATQFWVLVKNACGEAFTQNIQVNVNVPKRRSARS